MRGRRRRETEMSFAEECIMQLRAEEELRRERIRNDVFLDMNNSRTIFCRSLYFLLEELSDERESQCRENIYSFVIACLKAQRESRPHAA